MTHEWGRLALMADPFGNGYCFVQFLGGGYDEIAQLRLLRTVRAARGPPLNRGVSQAREAIPDH
jgi:hypothetical protein